MLARFLLLYCLVFWGAYYTYVGNLQERRLSAKQEAKRTIEKKEANALKRLRFSFSESKQLEWEGVNEFSFEGNMYDVVEQRASGDSITYLCYADEKETWLTHELDEIFKDLFGGSENTDEEHKSIKKLQLFYTTLFSENRFRQVGLSSKFYKEVSIFFDQRDLNPQFRPPKG